MKTKELRELSKEDLLQKEKNLKKELFDLHFHKRMGTVEKPSRFKALKKEIARIFTILRERELENERSSQKTK